METETLNDLIIDNTIEQICDDNSETINLAAVVCAQKHWSLTSN
jgi:hypothetical protein